MNRLTVRRTAEASSVSPAARLQLTPWRAFRIRFLRHRLAVSGAVVIVAFGLVAVLADVVAPHDPNAVNLGRALAEPGGAHLLGTDRFGRDVLSRLIHASRVSLSVGIVAVSIYLTIGVVVGGMAGFYRGFADGVLMRLTDMVMSFPTLMLILVIVGLVGPSIYNVMGVIGLLGWPPVARLVRADFLSLRERDFVLAARAIGATDARIMWRHMLPNTVGVVVVAATFGMAYAILIEAALSFLGFGVQPPTASWGNMLIDAQSLTILASIPWLWLPPGLAILTSVLAINFTGDGLRDALDPRMQL